MSNVIGEITIEKSPSGRYHHVKWGDVLLAVRNNKREAALAKAELERAARMRNLVTAHG